MEGSFLDLMIPIKDKKNLYKVVKRDSFPFWVVRMIVISHLNCFYSAFGAEILRSARTTNNGTIFQGNSKILVNQIIKQRGKPPLIDCLAITLIYVTITMANDTSLEFLE